MSFVHYEGRVIANADTPSHWADGQRHRGTETDGH